MSPAPNRRLAAALVLFAGFGVAGCGGGAEPLDTPTRHSVGAGSTLLDDDGLPMPSDPAALPAGIRPGSVRHATAAQADDLRRALGDRVRDVAAGCCGDDAVTTAIAAAMDPADGVPLAVLLDGSDLAAASAAAERLQAAGIERVWVVAER